MKIQNLSLLLLFTVMFSFTLVQAIEIEPGIQGRDKLLYQTCNNCTYCNVTNVQNQENITILGETQMTTIDGSYFSTILLGGNTTFLGMYSYCYDCGNSVDSKTGCINFRVTPSGRSGNDNIALIIILVVVIYAVTLIFFFGRNIPLSILTGMMMSFFGVWIVRNGIVIYRDNLTNYFGYVTIFIGAAISLTAILAWLDDMFN